MKVPERLESTIYGFEGFRLDAGKRVLFAPDGSPVSIMPKAFDTLSYLVANAGEVIDKGELMEAVWQDTAVEENNLNQNISALRKVFGERRGEHRFIATIPGKGYKFVAAVTRSEPAGEPPEEGAGPAVPNSPAPAAGGWRVHPAILAVSFLLLAGGAIAYLSMRGDTPASGARTIAVLPFQPLVQENRDEILEIGMADTLIARLGSAPELVVRPVSSVRKFAGANADPREAGRELSVDAVLEGNMQRWGDKLRVNVRLLDVRDGRSLWSGTFDEQYTDLFKVQDAIAGRVAEALKLRLGSTSAVAGRGTDNFEAYEMYVQGRYHTFKLTLPDVMKGIAFYEKAIEADPNFAKAYAGMADAYNRLPVTSDVRPHEAFAKAREAAKKALAIDPGSVDAIIVLGWVASWYERDWERSEDYFKQAVRLAPNSSEAHLGYAHLLLNVGRFDESIAEIRRARELDPVSLITNAIEGQTLFYAGRDQEAIERLNKTIELEPNFWVARINLAKVFIQQGRYQEAIAELRRAQELSGGNSETISLLGYALAKSGNRAEAEQQLAELDKASKDKYVPPYNIAMIYNGLGNREAALDLLGKAVEESDVRLIFLAIDHKWDELRPDPRFQAILKDASAPKVGD